MRNYKILLIDYEPRSVARIRDALEGAGLTVEVAGDGVAGIQAFHRIQPDLTLVEAMLPKKHGFEVCQELKQTPHGKSTPVLVITAVYKGRKYRHQAMHHYGANGYLEKPIDDLELVSTVRDALGIEDTPPASEPAHASAAQPGGAATGASTPHPQPRGGNGPSVDPTELEIIERLDSLIPGDLASGATKHNDV